MKTQKIKNIKSIDYTVSGHIKELQTEIEKLKKTEKKLLEREETLKLVEKELQNTISVVKTHEKFSKISAEISADLIDVSLENINQKLKSALAKTGKYATADRAFIWLLKDNNNLMDNTHEWRAPGTESFLEDLKDIPVPHYSWWMKKLTEKEYLLIQQVKNMPESILTEKNRLLEQNIASILSVPIFKGDDLLGFMGLSSGIEKKHWDIFLVQIIRSVANSIANALYSVRNQRKLLISKERAEENDRLKSAFLANMSHEIRTPLNGILGFIDLLHNTELTKKEQNLYFEMVKKSSDSLLNTINHIIEISKIESGQTPIINSIVSVNEIMNYLFTIYQTDAHEKGLELNLNVDNNYKKVAIQTDKTKLEVILKNLINNAIKFTNAGSVEIGYTLKENALIFCVTDTGPGISKERLDAIFNRMEQSNLYLSRPNWGTGLGLSISRAYAEMLHGKLWVESEPGKGSQFYFSLEHNLIKP